MLYEDMNRSSSALAYIRRRLVRIVCGRETDEMNPEIFSPACDACQTHD